jgi:hypothetical protein
LSSRGQCHGALNLVDLEARSFERVFEWAEAETDWAGAGGDRGLRGIAFTQARALVAACDRVLVFDPDFRLLATWSNRYLGHCHEMAILDDRLYVTSTAFDALLELDLSREEFVCGLGIRLFSDGQLSDLSFDPRSVDGPERRDTLHLNNVVCEHGALYVSGRRAPFLFEVGARELHLVARIPIGSHNPRPFSGGILLNDTAAWGRPSSALASSPSWSDVSRRWASAPLKRTIPIPCRASVEGCACWKTAPCSPPGHRRRR